MTHIILSIFTVVALSPALALAQEVDSQALAVAASPIDSDLEAGGQDGNGPIHEGFMLRASAGLALLGAGTDRARSTDVGAGGVGNAFSMAVGAYVAPNLALHAEILRAASSHMVVGTDDDTPKAYGKDFQLHAAGVGMTYYVMPFNLSLSGALMLGHMRIDEIIGPHNGSDYIVLGKFAVAKQWPVADDWGMGIGATLLAGAGHDGQAFELGIGGISIDAVATYD